MDDNNGHHWPPPLPDATTTISIDDNGGHHHHCMSTINITISIDDDGSHHLLHLDPYSESLTHTMHHPSLLTHMTEMLWGMVALTLAAGARSNGYKSPYRHKSPSPRWAPPHALSVHVIVASTAVAIHISPPRCPFPLLCSVSSA